MHPNSAHRNCSASDSPPGMSDRAITRTARGSSGAFPHVSPKILLVRYPQSAKATALLFESKSPVSPSPVPIVLCVVAMAVTHANHFSRDLLPKKVGERLLGGVKNLDPHIYIQKENRKGRSWILSHSFWTMDEEMWKTHIAYGAMLRCIFRDRLRRRIEYRWSGSIEILDSLEGSCTINLDKYLLPECSVSPSPRLEE